MLQVTENEIKKRLAFDNPWWETGEVSTRYRDWPRRIFFGPFYDLLAKSTAKRAVVLMGPRRVGKTVMLIQSVQQLIDDGVKAKRIFYVSIDTPTYTDLSLEQLLGYFRDIHGHGVKAKLYVVFDEIQYHKDWERHLKSLVDSYPAIRFVASGSAAAALRMKSRESGAGRFTDFLLPPLNFAEFLNFTGVESDLIDGDTSEIIDMEGLNQAFIDYINFGGFPEAVLDDSVRAEMDRFIANDIIDKVLLRDLPSLYGIADSQELKRFFTALAYATGSEVTYDNLSQSSGIAKNTVRKYLEYLEAAFLIRRLHRVDENAKRFKRVTHFKVYLTNPSIRAALFGPVSADDPAMGLVAETAFVSQVTQTGLSAACHYGRWKNGEVDLVLLNLRSLKVNAAVEIKWSDRAWSRPSEELHGLISFCKKSGLDNSTVLTRSRSGTKTVEGIRLDFRPLPAMCHEMAKVVTDIMIEDGINPLLLERHIETNLKSDP